MHKDFLLSENRTRENRDKISSIKLSSIKAYKASKSSSHTCLVNVSIWILEETLLHKVSSPFIFASTVL